VNTPWFPGSVVVSLRWPIAISPGAAYPVVHCSVPVISRVQAASPALIHTSHPQHQCLEYTFLSLCVSFSGLLRFAKSGARCSSRCVSLHDAVPYSSPRKGVQSALDCRIQNTPPPLTTEKATFFKSCLPHSAVLEFLSAPLLVPCVNPMFGFVCARLSLGYPLLMTGSPLRALVTRNRWFLARPAASPLVLLRRLVFAGPALAHTLGPFLRALVTRNRWFLARPAALPLVLPRRLVSAGSALARTPRSVLARACHAEPLVLGLSGSFRRWSCFAGWPPLLLRLSQPSLVTCHLSLVSAAHFLSATARSSRARIPLEFGCSRPVLHSWLYSFDCPTNQVKKT
jgi:hypothetical protein